MLHRIESVTAIRNHVLRIRFAGGGTVDVDLEPIIEQGGPWAALQDSESFKSFQIAADGRFIEWPEGLDLCADALWLAGHGEQRLAG